MARHLPATRVLRRTPHRRQRAEAPRRASSGFVLYVGLNDVDSGDSHNPAELAEIAETLRDLARDLLPNAETFTALAVTPGGGPGDLQDMRTRLAHLQPLDRAPDDATPPAAEIA